MPCYYLFIFLHHKFKFVSIKTVMIVVRIHARDTYTKHRKCFPKKTRHKKLIFAFGIFVLNSSVWSKHTNNNRIRSHNTLDVFNEPRKQFILCLDQVCGANSKDKQLYLRYMCMLFLLDLAQHVAGILKLIKQGNLPHLLICVKRSRNFA